MGIVQNAAAGAVAGKPGEHQAHSEGSITLPCSSCSAIVGGARDGSARLSRARKGPAGFALLTAWFWIPTPSCSEKSSEVELGEKACSNRSLDTNQIHYISPSQFGLTRCLTITGVAA